ncbi:SpoVG family protein [Botrimarina hoheduenensis]|uniref:Putative septation protein SpoVG n=1 Tax=Botrimarina hoheduenensis TaxID=2528000 RepID=A0A5C5WB95_9BACT|nr:SpoVG family protein [Botrimarina hoheduenensis]TWT47513.1 putative septation protein SpoVG [Botrimarina hoheduenensis]
MNITEVRIKLMDESGERLKAFCSITFDDCFVIRDLKVIEGTSGFFVAMPSRKLTAHCGKCGMKNHLRAAFCNQCGAKLEEARLIKDLDGRTKLYADIAHPINSRCREMIQERVIAEYQSELERAKLPDYVSRYDDYDGGDFSEEDALTTRRFDEPHSETRQNRPHHPPQGDPATTRVPLSPPHTPMNQRAPDSSPASRFDAADQRVDRRDFPADGFGTGIF